MTKTIVLSELLAMRDSLSRVYNGVDMALDALRRLEGDEIDSITQHSLFPTTYINDMHVRRLYAGWY